MRRESVMTYREMLELYSQGKLNEQQRTEIEKEIEKQQALTDYLFDHQIPLDMDGVRNGNPAFAAKVSDSEGNQIMNQINWSIRKSFIKSGFITVIVAIVLSLFITLVLRIGWQ